ncbi:DUF3850 domain-containing protein [Clostridium sp.]|uniref:DUF3850 domain-containing protein n=1 Tax=Clostridium sp. TaxID=1506 RepID=UPI0034639ECD
MKIHELKILPSYFEEIKSGEKAFELRKNDRNYQVGDVLLLKEFNLNKKYEDIEGNETYYSGRKILMTITYIFKDDSNNFGLDKDYVILGIKEISNDVELEWKSDMIKWGDIYCPMIGYRVMTYYPEGSRPYDTITNPFINEDGEVYYYKYDHDEGGWKDEIYSMCDADEYINLSEVLFY